MNKKLLLTQQLNAKIKAFAPAEYITSPPPTGWIKAIRTALGMSLAQLGKRLRITRQSVLEIERREKEGSITIKSLKEIATALDMQLVYGFVPNDGSLDALIEKKAKELAHKIVLRTSNTMILEDQGNSEERIDQAIKERTAIIKNELPKMLWD
jgi:predicted DNA-binding mobile mystery protein A